MKKEQMKKWIESIKAGLIKMPEFKGASGDDLNSAVMDGLFEGFLQGELHRIDLILAGEILGFELDEDFINDPHPDPIDLKKGK